MAEITLAALLALATNFQDGLRQLEAKQYAKAAAQFTTVVEAKPAVDELRELARVYRAKAYLGAGQKAKALEDASRLIRTAATSSHREVGVALYTQAGGTLKTLRPKEEPKAVMDKVLAALQADDAKTARTHLSGGLLRLLDTVDAVFKQQARGRSFIAEIGREFRNVNVDSQTMNDTNQTARLTVSMQGGSFTFALEQTEGAWVFADLLTYAPQQRHRMHHNAVEQQDVNKLRQLDAAIEQYTMANRKPPAQLADVADYVKNFAEASISAEDGKPFVFAIPKQGGKPWVFTATAVGGQRRGVINGSVRTVSEAEFKALAKTHGIRMRKDWKQVEVSDVDETAVRALIKQLGAGTSRERKAAYAELKAMGEQAGKLLDKATHDPDPEISHQAQNLLDTL
ncbi:MAG: hypothetical protein HN919_07575 [Verrucomicrobia bacterium]|nr:hypothetical protein [Verrucomicrobiota bacterium]MBT7066147.1 hypothetical protein [Verrucomicrobiota bacterium]MBT7699410.1 hypothetical protein [Verrucomicrobiota bacterium]